MAVALHLLRTYSTYGALWYGPRYAILCILFCLPYFGSSSSELPPPPPSPPPPSHPILFVSFSSVLIWPPEQATQVLLTKQYYILYRRCWHSSLPSILCTVLYTSTYRTVHTLLFQALLYSIVLSSSPVAHICAR